MAIPTSVLEGDTVVFTARSTLGHAVSVTGWTWQADSGLAITSLNHCGTNVSCSSPVFESGVAMVSATIAGDPQAKSATASVVVSPCSSLVEPDIPFDSIINSPSVRKELLAARLQGNINDPPSAGTRREVGGFFYRDSQGRIVAVVVPNVSPDPVCSYIPDPGFVPAGGYVRVDSAAWHAHPSRPGERVYGCQRTGNLPIAANPGPSGAFVRPTGGPPGDVQASIIRGEAGYMIEPDGRIYRWNYPPGLPGTPQANRIRAWRPVGGSSCLAQAPAEF